MAIQPNGEIISLVSQESEPAHVPNNRVKFVAMNEQHFTPIGAHVNRLLHDLDATKGGPGIITQELVMIAGNINDASALAGFPEQLLHDVIMRLWPMPGLAKTPSIHDIANKVNLVSLVNP